MKVNLILEGLLEEPLGHKLVRHCGHDVGSSRRLGGATNIKSKAYKYHSMTKYGEAVLVLTDSMDTGEPCITRAKFEYLEKHIRTPSSHFLLRFAVRELESWLIADRRGIANFLKVPISKVLHNPDTLQDPKQTLVNLARSSKDPDIVEMIVPDCGHGGVVGRGYTGAMTFFINSLWDVEVAQANSPSLDRCIKAITRL